MRATLIREILDGVLGSRGREHDGRLGIAKRRIETFGVPGQFGCEQGHRDGARLDRRVEPGDIIDALRRENRYALTTARGLLHERTDGVQADAELGPGHCEGLPVNRAAVVEVAIRDRVTDIRDVALDQRYQRRARRHGDAAVGIQAVLDLEHALWRLQVLPGTAIHTGQSKS